VLGGEKCDVGWGPLVCEAGGLLVGGGAGEAAAARRSPPPPPQWGGLDLSSSNSGCARLGSGVAPPLGVVKEEEAVLYLFSYYKHRNPKLPKFSVNTTKFGISLRNSEPKAFDFTCGPLSFSALPLLVRHLLERPLDSLSAYCCSLITVQMRVP